MFLNELITQKDTSAVVKELKGLKLLIFRELLLFRLKKRKDVIESGVPGRLFHSSPAFVNALYSIYFVFFFSVELF